VSEKNRSSADNDRAASKNWHLPPRNAAAQRTARLGASHPPAKKSQNFSDNVGFIRLLP
jgi:hypothetical protein